MATTNFTTDATAYVEVLTTDGLIQNKSPWLMYVHFGDSAPAADTEDYHVLTQYQAILKSGGLPSGTAYAISPTGRTNTGSVSN